MPNKLKIICFNVNGIRARIDQISEVLIQHQPDIIGLQETKVCDEEFPFEAIKGLGYDAHILAKKGIMGSLF